MKDFKLQLTAGNLKGTMKDVGASSSDLWKVELQHIHIIPGFQPRIDNAAYNERVTEYAHSILTNGYMMDKPLAGYVSDKGIMLTDGHTRLAAVKLANTMGANIERLPVVVKTSSTSAEDLTVALVTSNNGNPLSPYEIGVVAKRLEGYGWDTAQISTRLVLSEHYIKDLLLLMGADFDIRIMVIKGQCSAAIAMEAVKKHGAAAARVLTGAVTTAAAKGKTKATAKDLPGAGFDKACRKEGGRMYDILQRMLVDPAYVKLNQETRNLVAEVVGRIPQGDPS